VSAPASGGPIARPLCVLREPPAPSAEDPDRPYPPVFRLLAPGGVYEVRTTAAGQFCARVEALVHVEEGFYPALPPCPASLLARTVGIFKERPNTEAMVALVYDTETERYELVWQGEKADRSSVDYVPLTDDERHIVVVEIHSHHTMDAYFSRTDDASERASRIYGVIGRVERERPDALFRFACGSLPSGEPRFRFLRAEALFSPAAEVWAAVHQPTLS